MGEHSIIIPESRDIDRESGLRVVCESARPVKAAVGRSSSSAGGVRRRTIDIDACYTTTSSSRSSSGSAEEERRGGGGEEAIILSRELEAPDKSAEVKDEKKLESRRCRNRRQKNKNKNHPVTSLRFRGVVASSSRLLKRISLLLLSLLGILVPTSSSSSSVSTSRGHLLVSSSCALVSLLIVGLVRPTMAVPTATSTVSGNPSSSGSSSGSDSNAPLVRMMQQQHHHHQQLQQQQQRQHQPQSTVVDEEQVNFESVVEATMSSGRLRVVEDPPMLDESGDDDFTPRLHHRESGLESRSRLGEAELDTIRRSIVEGLGLERIPDPSKANVSQTEYRRAHEEYLTRLQHSRAGKEDGRLRRLHTFQAAEQQPMTLVNRTRRSANGTEEDVELLQRRESSKRHSRALRFPIEIPEDDDALVDHATLRFLLDTTGSHIAEETIHDVSVYRLAADSWRLVSRRSVEAPARTGPRWIELDVTDVASFWHEGEDQDNDDDDDGNEDDDLVLKLHFGSSNSHADDANQPIVSDAALNIFTTSYTRGENEARSSRRKRRGTPEHLMSLHKGRRTECRGDNKKCCRHEMTVIFKDLKGFEFIVQPKNFDAGYCKGRCPPRYNPAHHHALLQSLIWKEDKRKAPRPCCAPSKLDELEILYFDENDPTKLKVSSWKNMKVLECACS